MKKEFKINGGVLIIGSLLWQNSSTNEPWDNKRKKWRENHLKLEDPIEVYAPIRYGRYSSKENNYINIPKNQVKYFEESGVSIKKVNGEYYIYDEEYSNELYTMVLSKDYDNVDKRGKAKLYELRHKISSISDLEEEVKALSIAEGIYSEINNTYFRKKWGGISIWLSNKDFKLKSEIINLWNQKLGNKNWQKKFCGFDLAGSILNTDGTIKIDNFQVVSERKEEIKRVNNLDFILVAATVPKNKISDVIAYPNPTEIANLIKKDKRKYFTTNNKHGIITSDDDQILNKVNMPSDNKFHKQIIALLYTAKSEVLQTINKKMVVAYYEVGKMIIEKEQQGEDRAQYGKNLLKDLSRVLTNEFGKGFSVTNIQQMRNFYLTYRKQQTLSAKSKGNLNLTQQFILSWSHYLTLIRIDDIAERKFYEIEATKNKWSVRELKRQYNSALYTRLTLSRDKNKVKELSEQGLIIEKPRDAVKDPYILEFLELPENNSYSENELEEELIDKLEHFLLELGTGFTFVARQKRISFDDKHFRIDLVFYNRLLRCFVLFDLKIGELKHQDIGQMQMYVHYYDREIKLHEENNTIGIILCQNKSEAVVKYTLPKDNEQIFASKYQTILPSKEDLKKLIEKKD